MNNMSRTEEIMEKYNIDINFIRCTFLGRPVAQSFSALFLFEKVLLEYPFKRILEFGTWKGGLSLYLLLYCLSEKAEFYTYDIRKFDSYVDSNKKDILRKILEFDKYFILGDIFKNEQKIKTLLLKEGRSILFCDNGDKKLEFNTFAPHLKKGDVIGIHDWNKEVFFTDIEETVKKNELEMIFEDECTKYDDLIRFFKKNK